MGAFMGPQVHWVASIGKQMAKVLRAEGAIFQTVIALSKKADLSSLNDYKNLLFKLMDPASANFRRLADNVLVQCPEDFAKLNKLADGLGLDDMTALLTRVADTADLGQEVARKVVLTLGDLSPGQLATIKDAGKLDEVIGAVKFSIG